MKGLLKLFFRKKEFIKLECIDTPLMFRKIKIKSKI